MSTQNIVVVDDQPSICREVTAFLKNSYTVHAFTTGEEALEFLLGNHVDLMLLDYDMPGMTGYQVLMSVRLSHNNEKMPIVFLTGETNERMREEMLGRGATDYLCKPVTSDALHHCIQKYLA